ncbi:hypothetical protein A2526_06025 [candidate division WOR-1 bacterium RIFOXYD2_FULL_36_8]|uniref:SLH domain-containing protein n=1 Tax=candidate division WOR-1 bacterium RIFOXYB2_FULL_36_35 TaxID=1802578 RepID=A0A1F4S5P9_UNCSA|nr:MAG: hypothetical protein A2230_05020 [candidate division WOR-1 bacterium RIFOXYA2_FULL_36_21]OGC15765.1 MAG: hypothetical protein A2290_05445 [candidate division WOR-1 bacterium RIFOXYB2_FULL_36_35]OGC21120.1 MAG: hypothetical protein A2282_03775 [candidate division WOR-1 bacterium RIFOXYA12_FULL_36_13]OGC39031.1 MAG: hypothetical protein A2526_06025 [candidate division WOR-1 bacterium RIFOXYD2_FULL_36_8]
MAKNLMIRGLTLLILILLISGSCYAEVKFKDLPADHWAASSVYDLVRLGVTSGYPDGTFRGKNNITRYETAILIAKLAEKLPEMDVTSIQSELNSLKNEIAKVRKGGSIPITGEYEMFSKVSNLLATGGVNGRGPIMVYRLKTNIDYDLNDSTNLKVGFDTMDSGFDGTTRDLAKEIIDVVGTVKIDPVDTILSDFGLENNLDLTFAMGPGNIRHVDSTGFIPSETGYTYLRPDSGVYVGTNLLGFDVLGGYKQALKTNAGASLTSDFTGSIAYNLTGVPLLEVLKVKASGDYLQKHGTEGVETRGIIDLATSISDNIGIKTKLGLTSTDSKGWMVGGELSVANVLNSGTNVVFKGSKVGALFIPSSFAAEVFDAAGFDFFNRPLESSTVNFGGLVSQKLGDKLEFQGKGDLRLSPDYGYGSDKAKSRATGQVGFAYEIAPLTTLDTFYRVEQDPTVGETTDLAAMGLIYKF